MATTLTALLAAAIHDARAAGADPSSLAKTAEILAMVAHDDPLDLQTEGARLVVNGLPLPPAAPGAELVREALGRHGVDRLTFPPALDPEQWQALALVLAADPGLSPSMAHLQAAILGIAPGASVSGSGPETFFIQEVMIDAPPAAVARTEIDPNVTATDGDRAVLSGQLDPLLEAGQTALGRRDWPELVRVVLALATLEESQSSGSRAIIARERRRIVPETALDAMVRQAAEEGQPSSPATEAVIKLGRSGAEALIGALASDPPRIHRRLWMAMLERIGGIDELIIRGITSPSLPIARDMAELAGRLRIEAAVPNLAVQLKHADASVRTPAWRALEEIGTIDALAALHGDR